MSALFDLPDDLFSGQISPLYERFATEAEARMRVSKLIELMAEAGPGFIENMTNYSEAIRHALSLLVMPFVFAEKMGVSTEEYMLHPPKNGESVTEEEWLFRQKSLVTFMSEVLKSMTFLETDEIGIWERVKAAPDPVEDKRLFRIAGKATRHNHSPALVTMPKLDWKNIWSQPGP